MEATKQIRINVEAEAEQNLEKHKMSAAHYGFNEPTIKGINSKRKPKKEKTSIAQHQKELSEAVLTDDTSSIYDLM